MVKRNKSIHRRNIKFKTEVSKTDKSRILGVAIDTSKSFHRVLIFNFLGKIIQEPFSIDTLQSGYVTLIKKIVASQKKIKAQKTFIALETPAKYTDNLVYHLRKDFGLVCFVSPFEVSENRSQRTFVHVKSDDIDTSSVADLLIHGEFTEYIPLKPTAIKLKTLIHWRDQKLKIRTILKHQIEHRVARILPGLNTTFDGHKKVYGHAYESQLHLGLIKLNKTAQDIMKLDNRLLRDKFGYQNYSRGSYHIKKLKNRLDEMLLPEERSTRIELEFLKKDFALYEMLNEAIANAEKEIISLGYETEAKYLFNQIKGIGELSASMYVGLVGNIERFDSAKKIYSYAGLSPRRYQSGGDTKQSLGIKRHGNKLLRSFLFRLSTTIIKCNPKFNTYYKNLRQNGKSWKESIVIVAKRLNNILFALIRDKSTYEESSR